MAFEEGGEAGLGGPRRTAHRGGEAVPLRVGADGDGAPGVLAAAGVDPVRSGLEAAVALPPALLTVHGVVEDGGAEELKGGLDLREVEVLALAGAVAVVQRRHDREHREPRRDHVGVGDGGAARVAVGPSGDVVHAGEGLKQVADAGVRRLGAFLS